MRLLRLVLAATCILLGAIVGALNPEPVRVDLGIASFGTSLGVAVLVAVLAGVVAGGALVAIGRAASMRMRARAPGEPGRGNATGG